MKLRHFVFVLIVVLFSTATASADGCPYFCKTISLDVANCYEVLTGKKGVMVTCQEVVWCWPSLVDPVYCEATCEGSQCYWV